jgi:peptidoglycan/LPS O-acetylase OafA/YrhL
VSTPQLSLTTPVTPAPHKAASAEALPYEAVASEVVPAHAAMPKRAANSHSHYPALDGLRGTAILAVFLFHFGGGSHEGTNLPLRLYLAFIRVGWMGVDLFFVLSGFLITGILYDTAHKEDRIKNFYARRALRIFPLFYGVLFAFLLLTPVLHLKWHAGHILYFLYLYNMVPMLAPHLSSPGSAMVLNHFWSLSVEEQFYLLWPFVIWLVRDRRRLLWISVAFMLLALGLRLTVVLHGGSQDEVFGLLPTRADSLLFGAAVALLVRGPAGKRLPATPVAIVSGLLSLLVLLSGHVWYYGTQLIATVGYTSIGIFFACIVYWAQTGEGWVARIFSAPFLRFFGRYSYGLYIYQGLLLVFMMPYVHTVQRLVHSDALGGVLYILLSLVLLLGLSMLSFHFFEEPILRHKKYFS